MLRRALDRDPVRRFPTITAFQAALVAAATTSAIELGPHVIARRLVELGVPA